MNDNLCEKSCNDNIKDAVCIDTKRIYDSCVSKDCLEDLRVTFTDCDQALIDDASSVKCCCCKVKAVAIDVDDVPFNKGFYTVTIKYFFKLKFEVYKCSYAPPKQVKGYATFEKKCILYGGEGSAKMFISTPSDTSMSPCCSCGVNMQYPKPPVVVNPVAKLQTVDPVVLDCTLTDSKVCDEPMCGDIPKFVIGDKKYCLPEETQKTVLVTLGIFSIIQLERDVQMLIPAYDFCIPDKECCCSTQNPCDAFQKIDFPVDEFFPPNKDTSSGCNCANDNENVAE